MIPSVLPDVNLRLGAQYGLSLGSFNSDVYLDTSDVEFQVTIPGQLLAYKSMQVRSTTHRLAPSITFDWQPGSNWQLGVGIWGDMLIGTSGDRKEILVDSGVNSTLFFVSTSSKERELFPERGVGFNYFRLGPTLSSSWKISAGRNLEFRPEIYGKLDILSAKSMGLRAFSAGIRFNFNLNPEVGRISRGEFAESELSDDERAKEIPKLSAVVRITSNGVSLDDAVTAEPRSILYRRFETILPYIEVPTVTDRPRVDRLIDILSKRINEIPASISVAPTATDPTLPEAGRQFANLIASTAERSRAENGAQHAAPINVGVQQPVKLKGISSSGLTINSDQPSLLRPYADQWIDSRYQLPPITIERFTDTRAGLKSWNVTVRQGRRMLARYSNLEGSTAELESGLLLTSEQSSSIEPLYAEMTVTDLTDQTITVFDTLQIRKGITDPERADSTVYEFLFYSTQGVSGLSEALNVSNKALMKTLKDQVIGAKNLEIHYGSRSQKYASEIFNEISSLFSEDDNGLEIRLRASRDVAAPAGIMSARVILSR